MLAEGLSNEQDARNYGRYREEQSKSLPHKFYKKYLKNDEASKKAGRPIYEAIDFIKIQTDEINHIDAPVNETYKRRFSQGWERYTQEKDIDVNGTLLIESNFMPMTEALSYQEMGILTVEQLIEQKQNTNVNQDLVKLAEHYINSSKVEGGLSYLLSVIEDLNKKLEYKDKVIEELRKDGNS